jgi:hypothetical protein
LAVEDLKPFDPSYPTPAAQRYRDEFLEAAFRGRVAIHDEKLISRAITRALERDAPATYAGHRFSVLYIKIDKQRRLKDWLENEFYTYLLAAFGNDLTRNHKTML